MPSRIRSAFLAAGLAVASAAPVAAAPAPPPQTIILRVQVDASGRVTSTRSLDPKAIPVLAQAAQELAGKLVFSPAQKNGRAVPSETSLSMVLALQPRAGGSFGVSLQRASSGPSVVELGKSQPPKVSAKDNGGVVVVGVDLRPDGSVDMESFKEELVELRVPSSFAGARFVEATRHALAGTRFMLDKVDGIETPARISVPFQFNGGAGNVAAGGDPSQPRVEKGGSAPSLKAVSKIEGVVLPRVDYSAGTQ